MFIVAIKWARRVIKEFETAREIAPEDLDVRFDMMEYYLNAPAMLGGGEDKAEAEAQVEKWAAKNSVISIVGRLF